MRAQDQVLGRENVHNGSKNQVDKIAQLGTVELHVVLVGWKGAEQVLG